MYDLAIICKKFKEESLKKREWRTNNEEYTEGFHL